MVNIFIYKTFTQLKNVNLQPAVEMVRFMLTLLMSPPPPTTTSSNSQGANNFLLTVPKSWCLQLEPGKCIGNQESDTKNFTQKHKGVGWTNCLVNCTRYLHNGHSMYIKGTDVARVHVAR
jgi:hypothetical protein